MKVLTHSELEQLILDKLNGVSEVEIKTTTKQTSLNKGRGGNKMVDVLKVDPDKLIKHTALTAFISGDETVNYESLVNERLDEEAREKGKAKSQLKFSAGERKWGTHIENCPALVEYNGTRYISVFCENAKKPTVTHTYLNEAVDLSDKKFNEYRKPEKKSGSNQGTEDPIVPRTYKFDNIREIKIFGESYTVIPDVA